MFLDALQFFLVRNERPSEHKNVRWLESFEIYICTVSFSLVWLLRYARNVKVNYTSIVWIQAVLLIGEIINIRVVSLFFFLSEVKTKKGA